MSAHTPGRLTLGKFASARGGPEIEYVNGCTAQQVFSCQPMEYADHNANARRLVACWNACDGMETHDIEALSTLGNVGDMFRSLYQQIGSVKADLMRSDIKLAAARAERDKARDDLLAVRDESRAIEANYEAARALPIMPDGWAMATADFSIIARGGVRPGSVTLIRTGADLTNWHAHADADVIPLYAVGRGPDFLTAMQDAVRKAKEAPPVPSSKQIQPRRIPHE